MSRNPERGGLNYSSIEMVVVPVFAFFLLGLENGHFWAKLHLCSTERQKTAGSLVVHSESVVSERDQRHTASRVPFHHHRLAGYLHTHTQFLYLTYSRGQSRSELRWVETKKQVTIKNRMKSPFKNNVKPKKYNS
jgi:hypothetical protein